jgi:hypothetical protein
MTDGERKTFDARVDVLRREWGLVPVSFAATLAGVSRTRIDQLIASGAILGRDFLGWKVVSVSSLSKWYRRKAKRRRRRRVSQMRLPLLTPDKAAFL